MRSHDLVRCKVFTPQFLETDWPADDLTNKPKLVATFTNSCVLTALLKKIYVLICDTAGMNCLKIIKQQFYVLRLWTLLTV